MSKLKRLTNWQTKHLYRWFQEVENKPFSWGRWDCCIAVASAIEAQTGVDIAEDFRSINYTTKIGAFKAIKKITGGNSVADAVEYCANKHEMVEYKHPLCAQRGDLCVVDNKGEQAAAIVALDGKTVVGVGENGLIYLQLTAVRRAWKVSEHIGGVPSES